MLELILGTVFLIYILFIGQLIYGFNRMRRFSKTKFTPKTSFTIVVPFRNEKENLPNLLHSIALLNYPKELVEVILVDDDSDDEFRIQNLEFRIQMIKNVRKSNSPKKDAIETAIQIAKHDWIITTDADCLVQKDWLTIYDQYIQKNEVEMVASGVCYVPKNGFLSAFQNLDFLSLQGATIGSFGINQPFMCNGANFAYSKSFFKELNGFQGNETIASGDDVFLLQKAVSFAPKKVGFLLAKESIVATKPVATWSELFQQRVRWASKSTGYSSVYGKLLALVVFGGNLAWIVSFLLWLVGLLDQNIFMLFVALKFLIDFILIYKTANFFESKLQYVFASSLLYPFFSVSVAVYSLFGKYSWKGRNFKK
ncbi:glycosyltransferase family 2 protein [Flavobacterium cheniae]|uniref:Cellulose synthase/poly-beta-1,6-N-acetylglucosamine synthase-like glycosyltransferase n=1 Tax=Flavobacterium cheniae TaxID=295428 RepID=A0A562KM93_9FLAO|nr:glycosyltransferase [Flavobacterium cheniae]TDR24255.1 cellulose synthase/poly-beta-1,6-N-acetylglucosamine synthase-like glycosyltransferase [Flavobacterium cheniae]TWH96375.1 cellulose synthase/poly-beta-1,6-N-acetylglucosamine synthase-like glycosyltransferase [Flavobacterium cheniae]